MDGGIDGMGMWDIGGLDWWEDGGIEWEMRWEIRWIRLGMRDGILVG